MSTLGRRIYFLVAGLIAAIALAVTLAAVSTGRLVTSTRRLGNVNLATIGLIQELGSVLDRDNSIVNGAPAEMDLAKGKAKADTFRRSMGELDKLFVQLAPLTADDPELKAEVDVIRQAVPGFSAGAEKVFKAAEDFLQQQAVETLQNEVNPVQDKIRAAQQKLTTRALAVASAAPAQIAGEAKAGQQLVIIVGLATLVLGGGASGWVVRRYVVAPLRGVVADLSVTSDRSAGSARSVAEASQTLAAGASEQAAAVEETSATLEEIGSVTKRNAENAQNTRELATKARQAAEGGATEMKELTAAVAEIKAAGDNIAQIIKTIDEIAFQTNILALNAAVEAARAGDAGLGFAVVADEVRNLAQRSVTAARETAEKIDRSLRASQRGVEITGRVATRLGEIVTAARDVDGLVTEIASASNEQTAGIAQVDRAVSQIEKVTQTNAASAEETSGAAQELDQQTRALRAAIARLYTLVEGELQGVQTAHREQSAAATPSAAVRATANHAPAGRKGSREAAQPAYQRNGDNAVAHFELRAGRS